MAGSVLTPRSAASRSTGRRRQKQRPKPSSKKSGPHGPAREGHEEGHEHPETGGSGKLQSKKLQGEAKFQDVLNGMTLIRVGSSGTPVVLVQESLLAVGIPLPQFGADGKFGSETKQAVEDYQKQRGLQKDGIVGPDTLRAFDRDLAAGGGHRHEVRGGDFEEVEDPPAPEVELAGGGEQPKGRGSLSKKLDSAPQKESQRFFGSPALAKTHGAAKPSAQKTSAKPGESDTKKTRALTRGAVVIGRHPQSKSRIAIVSFKDATGPAAGHRLPAQDLVIHASRNGRIQVSVVGNVALNGWVPSNFLEHTGSTRSAPELPSEKAARLARQANQQALSQLRKSTPEAIVRQARVPAGSDDATAKKAEMRLRQLSRFAEQQKGLDANASLRPKLVRLESLALEAAEEVHSARTANAQQEIANLKSIGHLLWVMAVEGMVTGKGGTYPDKWQDRKRLLVEFGGGSMHDPQGGLEMAARKYDGLLAVRSVFGQQVRTSHKMHAQLALAENWLKTHGQALFPGGNLFQAVSDSVVTIGGGGARPKPNGKMSKHGLGEAVDINAASNPQFFEEPTKHIMALYKGVTGALPPEKDFHAALASQNDGQIVAAIKKLLDASDKVQKAVRTDTSRADLVLELLLNAGAEKTEALEKRAKLFGANPGLVETVLDEAKIPKGKTRASLREVLVAIVFVHGHFRPLHILNMHPALIAALTSPNGGNLLWLGAPEGTTKSRDYHHFETRFTAQP